MCSRDNRGGPGGRAESGEGYHKEALQWCGLEYAGLARLGWCHPGRCAKFLTTIGSQCRQHPPARRVNNRGWSSPRGPGKARGVHARGCYGSISIVHAGSVGRAPYRCHSVPGAYVSIWRVRKVEGGRASGKDGCAAARITRAWSGQPRRRARENVTIC